jgi:prolyl oligopeptidase PreP (S9A serine peptidase family)
VAPARLRDEEMFYRFDGYTIPPGYCRLDVRTGKSTLIRRGKVDFDASAFKTRQIFYKSKDGTRVPMFISARKGLTTADHDDRVMPRHSLKYAATLQRAQEGPAPILIRIDTRAGHGGGKPTSKLIDEWTDCFAFLRTALKM